MHPAKAASRRMRLPASFEAFNDPSNNSEGEGESPIALTPNPALRSGLHATLPFAPTPLSSRTASSGQTTFQVRSTEYSSTLQGLRQLYNRQQLLSNADVELEAAIDQLLADDSLFAFDDLI